MDWCPATVVAHYAPLKKVLVGSSEKFFVYRGHRKVTGSYFRRTLAKCLRVAGYTDMAFSAHSFRMGGATDLFRAGWTYEQIKEYGGWRSMTVKRYVRL